MAQFYIGEILLVPYNFAPLGFLECDGSLKAIAEFETLFNLIGTTYGGDGQETFAVPDLRGRAPIHMGQGLGLSSYTIGQIAGTESVTLTTPQLPSHSHAIDSSALAARLRCQSAAGTERTPVGNVPAREAAGVTNPYSTLAANTDMRASTFSLAGAASIAPAPGSTLPHDNLQPLLCMTYCICWVGIFPPQ